MSQAVLAIAPRRPRRIHCRTFGADVIT